MRLVSFRRSLAAALIVCAVGLPLQPGLAADAAVFSGRVVDKDGFLPRTDVVVRLVETSTEQTWASAPTGDEGAFRIESAPAGSYAVLAETAEGKYLAGENVQLAAGENTPVQLALDPGVQPVVLAPGQTRSTLPAWAKGVIAGVMVIAAVALFDSAQETEASKGAPF